MTASQPEPEPVSRVDVGVAPDGRKVTLVGWPSLLTGDGLCGLRARGTAAAQLLHDTRSPARREDEKGSAA